MEEKDFHQALKIAIESSNALAVERACVNLSFSNTVMFLGQKEKLKLLSKNTDEKFVKDLLYFLTNKKNEENQRYPNHVDGNSIYGDHDKFSKGSNFQHADKKYVESFKKGKDAALESFKNSVFVGLIGGLKSDDVKYLKILDLYWPDRKNVNQLAKKCGAEGFVNITHKLLSEFKKPKEDSRYQININYFLKNVVKEANVEFLNILWKTYSRDMKQVFQFLRSHDQFWMHELPKTETDVKDEISYQRMYSTDPEIFNIKNFTYEKLMWFEGNSEFETLVNLMDKVNSSNKDYNNYSVRKLKKNLRKTNFEHENELVYDCEFLYQNEIEHLFIKLSDQKKNILFFTKK